mmetsp:Transcript_56840/g.184126  ORF Transcript_56840/g.184126 Transcript_56840/m.184126 type:complete len:286 (-) Transcript_56840:158-1015(-)
MSPADHSTTIPKLHSQTCARDIDDESDISTQRGSQSSVCFDSDMSFGPMELGRKSSAEFASASTTGSWCPPGIGSFDSDTELQFTQFSRMLRPSSLEPLPAAEGFGHTSLIAATEAEATGCAHLIAVAASAAQRTAQRTARRSRFLNTPAVEPGRVHAAADVVTTAIVASENSVPVGRAHVTAAGATGALLTVRGRANVIAEDTAAMASNEAEAATAATASERAPAIGRAHVTAGGAARAVVASLRRAAIGRAHATADITTMAAAASQRVISTGNAEQSATTVGV